MWLVFQVGSRMPLLRYSALCLPHSLTLWYPSFPKFKAVFHCEAYIIPLQCTIWKTRGDHTDHSYAFRQYKIIKICLSIWLIKNKKHVYQCLFLLFPI